jgi:uncharacterized membrane-anchored protein YjiN (DUF445 family)
MKKTSCIEQEKNKEILHRVKEDKNILHKKKKKKGDQIGQILSRNFLLKHVVEEKIESTGRRGRRRKQLLDNLKGTR